jgi:2-polyprenyl-3-methyl-5-hydroxy-6-metoxy-1,4-benzoquinol methylase
MKRVAIAELLDSDAGTATEIEASLSDLRRINIGFGGVRTTQWMIERVARERGRSSLSILEVASGTGYVIDLVRQQLRTNGIQLQVTLLDRAPSHLSNGSPRIAADALQLPFRDRSFDLVSCNLFLHHLAPQQVRQFAMEALRVSNQAFLINDVIRSRIHLALVYAGMPLFRSRLTRHDAPASVRQAYTPAEIRELLAQIPGSQVEISRHYLFRMSVIAWK